MSRIIGHIDLNTFFVRCEEIKDPNLIGKPVGIGGEGRAGIISTCSYEARAYGVKSGMPTFEAKSLCPNLILKEPDFELINLLSNEFFSYLRQYSTKIESFSCDECFIDLTESYLKYGNNDINAYLKKIQNGLFKKTQLKCSIGIGPTKFLAKMGSDYKKPMGITIIRKKDIKKILFPLPVGDFYGIGKKSVPRLNKIGIYTIGDLYNGIKSNNEKLLEIFENQKNYILDCLEGRSSDIVESETRNAKSIGTTRTLPQNSSDRVFIYNFFENEVDRIIKQLKSEKMLTKTIQITYKSSICLEDFKVNTVSKSFDNYTDNERTIKEAAKELFESSYNNKEIRLIGFTLKNLILKRNAVTQMTFDDYGMHEKENETYLIINKLNRKFKKEVLKKASEITKK